MPFLLIFVVGGCLNTTYSGGDKPINMMIGFWLAELQTEDGGSERIGLLLSQSGRDLVVCETKYPAAATFEAFYSGETWFNKVQLNRDEIGIGRIDAEFASLSWSDFDQLGDRYVAFIETLAGGDVTFANNLHQYYAYSKGWQVIEGTYRKTLTDGEQRDLDFLAYRLDKDPYRDYDANAEEYIETEMQLCVYSVR